MSVVLAVSFSRIDTAAAGFVNLLIPTNSSTASGKLSQQHAGAAQAGGCPRPCSRMWLSGCHRQNFLPARSPGRRGTQTDKMILDWLARVRKDCLDARKAYVKGEA